MGLRSAVGARRRWLSFAKKHRCSKSMGAVPILAVNSRRLISVNVDAIVVLLEGGFGLKEASKYWD